MANTKKYYPRVLLLASRYDLTCDFVVAQLINQQTPYLRLNSEDLSSYDIDLDPINRNLNITRDNCSFSITPNTLKSVFFRRPVFLRDYGGSNTDPEDSFSRHQWAAFIRNLMLFDKAKWFNDPTATYRSEHKAVQLAVANDLGFAIPKTRITNCPHPTILGQAPGMVAVKGLDTVLVRSEKYEVFGFTTFEDTKNINPSDWRSAPATIQDRLTDKLDLRVTVVDSKVFTVSIKSGGKPIRDDWRTDKSNIEFSKYALPNSVADRCRKIVNVLGLRFGAIDLAYCGNKYYFLEINPTGEWAWLVDSANLPIDIAIAKALSLEVARDDK